MTTQTSGADAMSRELDEISRAIGRMEEAIAQGNHSRDRLNQKMDELAKAMNSFGHSITRLAEDVEEMKPLVSDYRDQRSRAKGVMTTLTVGAALVGATAGKLLELMPAFIKG
jgi:septal ring factor EnvC (AmiA/AmiB activator)